MSYRIGGGTHPSAGMRPSAGTRPSSGTRPKVSGLRDESLKVAVKSQG